DLGEGLEAQYCHLRNGSLKVAPGDAVSKGDALGDIGASGWAQFPHVHLTITRNGVKVDPDTGREVGSGCAATPAQALPTLWDEETAPVFGAATAQIMALGFSGGAIDYDSLVQVGPPSPPQPGAGALVGWAWYINLR